jgi:hypothetical protein
MWQPGRIVLRRQFHRGELLGRVWVARVAADEERGLWLWIANGSPYLDVAAADGRGFRDVPFGEWGATAKTWRDKPWASDVLMFHPASGEYSVWFFFHPDGSFRLWYVNLELSSRRWDDGPVAGIDTVDYDLDIVVAPDRSWQWKDIDEFAAHLRHPDVYWVDDEAAVWAEGRRVVALIEAGVFPFDGAGTDFRPDPQWTVPVGVPAGHDRPRVYADPSGGPR